MANKNADEHRRKARFSFVPIISDEPAGSTKATSNNKVIGVVCNDGLSTWIEMLTCLPHGHIKAALLPLSRVLEMTLMILLFDQPKHLLPKYQIMLAAGPVAIPPVLGCLSMLVSVGRKLEIGEFHIALVCVQQRLRLSHLRLISVFQAIEKLNAIDKLRFTNVYVQTLAESTADADLRNIFGDAANAVEALNGQQFEDKAWHVGTAQEKEDGDAELKHRFEQTMVRIVFDSRNIAPDRHVLQLDSLAECTALGGSKAGETLLLVVNNHDGGIRFVARAAIVHHHLQKSAVATPHQSPPLALKPWVVFDSGGMIFFLLWLLLHTIHHLEALSAVFDPGGDLVSRYFGPSPSDFCATSMFSLMSHEQT